MKATIAFDQPKLSAVRDGPDVVVSGNYLLLENGEISNPAGPISEYDIRVVLSDRYPISEPKVFEIGGRIPRSLDRHVNSNGECCIAVWENWLIRAEDHSFKAFMDGPLYEFFLSQYWFEKTGKWPFGEWTHGPMGLVEAYAHALGIPNEQTCLIYYLRLLSLDWPKGHWRCPCGSGKLLRHCHRDELMVLHERVPPRLAARMLRRLTSANSL